VPGEEASHRPRSGNRVKQRWQEYSKKKPVTGGGVDLNTVRRYFATKAGGGKGTARELNVLTGGDFERFIKKMGKSPIHSIG